MIPISTVDLLDDLAKVDWELGVGLDGTGVEGEVVEEG